MAKINILPDILCNQIAAGEVVERPAAVVKELMENSVDAGSRAITVRIVDAGRREICVADNGDGMSPDDALLAIERHATSKIRTVEDLQHIHSLGFRGEALPSIAAVSRFELVSREPHVTAGTRLVMEGGVLRDVRDIGCPAGTQIWVRDLFFNVPARRKFLRSNDTEMAHISDQFLRLAMAHPHIHCQMQHQGRVLYDLPQASGHLERAMRILGLDLAAALQPFAVDHTEVRAHGLIGPPELQRASNQHLFVYVNGRPVWDRALYRMVIGAYDSLLPKGRYPVAVVFLEMPPELVDVNVHPTKREIRLRNPAPILAMLQNTVRGALEDLHEKRYQRSVVAPSEMLRPSPWRGVRENDTPITAGSFSTELVPGGVEQGAALPGEAVGCSLPPTVTASLPWVQTKAVDADRVSFAGLPLLGQLASSYILLEAPDGLVIIDQHAAHERIIYERLHAAVSSSIEARQRLTHSVVLEFLPRQVALLQQWLEPLGELGYDIEPFGGNSFAVKTVPASIAALHPVEVLRDLVETDCGDEIMPTRAALLDVVAKSAACRQAVKARHKLARDEIRSLLEDLDRTLLSSTCPHGRPLWWKLTHADIARFFQRSQAPGSLRQRSDASSG
jgi:DNA mismatch repair protein MutL